MWCPSGTALLASSEEELATCFAKVGGTKVVEGYEDCMLNAWDTCYMTRCEPDGSWSAKFIESANSNILLQECAGFCRLQPANIEVFAPYRQNIRENAAEFAELTAKQFSFGAQAKLHDWALGQNSSMALKFPFARDIYSESDMISCYRSGIAASDGSGCILHWGSLAAWRYLKEVPNHGSSFDVKRLTRLMGESIVGSVTRQLERKGSRASLAEFAWPKRKGAKFGPCEVRYLFFFP